MFEVGFAELFLLGVIALLVVGPDKLPGLARTVGVWVGKAQRLVGQVRADIEREVRADELRKAAKEYSPTNVISDMRKEVEDFASEVSKPVDLDAESTGSAKPGAGDGRSAGGAATPASPSAPEPPFEAGAADEVAGTDAGSITSTEGDESEGDESKTERAPKTPAAASGAGNGADAQAAKTREPETGGAVSPDPPAAGGAQVPPVEPAAADPDLSEPQRTGDAAPAVPEVGGTLSNGQGEDAAATPMTESAEDQSAERDERTAAP